MDTSIAVVVTARDAAGVLASCLDSIAKQSAPPDEVVIVNDGSTDTTSSLARSYSSTINNLIVIDSTPKGIGAGRNIGNKAARSSYIAVLDADDLFHKDAILRYKGFISQNPEADVVYGDYDYYFVSSKIAIPRKCPQYRNNDDALHATLGGFVSWWKHSSMLYKRSVIERAGGYDESLAKGLDFELVLRFLKMGAAFKKIDYTVCVHRHWKGSSSVNKRLLCIKDFYRIIDSYEKNSFKRACYKSARTCYDTIKFILRV